MNDYITKIDNFVRPLAERGGFQMARVGGSVRDELLGRRVKDADYVAFGVSLSDLGDVLTGFALGEGGCSVSPLKLRDGRQAGWRLFKKGYGMIEIMLPRVEHSTGPGHRDFQIDLDPSLTPAQDAIRRDFTFNALYKWLAPDTRTTVSSELGILHNITDPTGRGLYDLQHKLVHTTHADSFRDDPLRILRALRFVSVLGYDLSSDAHDEMIEHAEAAHGLSHVYKHEATSHIQRMDGGYTIKKRIPGDNKPELTVEAASGTVLDEMSKLLMGDDVGKALRLMRDTGVMAVMFPELAPMIGHDPNSNYHDLTTCEHTIRALEAAAKANAPLEVRWALLFHDSGKPEVEWIGPDGRKHYYAKFDGTEDHEVASERRWRSAALRMNVPKALREAVARIILEHMVTVQPRNVRVKVARMRVKWGDRMTHDILLHRVCDLAGKNKTSTTDIGHVANQETIRQDLEAAEVPTTVKDLAIGGRDVAAMGVKGKAVGEALQKVLDEVICQPTERNRSREWQLARVEALVKR